MNNDKPMPRRFTVADGMIVIAALAGTFALAGTTLSVVADLGRCYYTLICYKSAQERYFWLTFDHVQMNGLATCFLVLTIIFFWMTAYAAMRLRRPRPPISAIVLEPGMAALGSAAATFPAVFAFRFVTFGQETGYLVVMFFYVWVFAYAAMRLRRPHPPFHVAALPPGRAAAWSSAIAFAALLLFRLAVLGLEPGYLIATVVLLWMIAYAASRLRRPGPTSRVALVQSALAVFGSVVTASAAVFLFRLLSHPVVYAEASLVVACLAVPVAWRTLKVAGRWRAEANWLARFGRVLGLCWWTVSWLTAAFLIHLFLAWGPSPHYQAYT